MEKGQTITVHERDESGYDTKTYLISSAGSIGSCDSEGIHASIIPAEVNPFTIFELETRSISYRENERRAF